MCASYLLKEFFESCMSDLERVRLNVRHGKEFKNWLESKVVYYRKDQVEWNDKSYNLDFTAQRGFCHANSLRLYLDFNIEISSGFSIQSYSSTEDHSFCVIHSFNLANHRVIDYTYYQDKDYLMDRKLLLPCGYIGVTIPDIFIKALIYQIINPRFGSISNPKIGYFFPLIVSYFYFDRGDSYWRECLD